MRYILASFCLYISGITVLAHMATAASEAATNHTLTMAAAPRMIATTREALLNSSLAVGSLADKEEEEDYDYDDEETRRKQSRQRNKNIIKRVGITYAWDRWEKWSKCSALCFQIRRRKCLQRTQNDPESEPHEHSFYPDASKGAVGCRGMLTRYRICKDDRCKGSSQADLELLRDSECQASLAKNASAAERDGWVSHVPADNECEMHCRRGTEIVSLQRPVQDGSPCQRPAVYYTHHYRGRAICVEGVCKAVHSSGAIRPATTNDSQQKCGSVQCQTVSEVFSKAKLSYGYNYVTNIPVGAMNLTIKQLSRSDNLLALKTTEDIYLINGNSRASDSGLFEYEEDSYDYNKELSIITAKGPLTKSVVLMLFVRGLNTGVKYDYLLPVPSAAIPDDEEPTAQWNELGQPLDEIDENSVDGAPILAQIQRQRTRQRNRQKFTWKLLGFGECNRSCGPGVQTPIFRCIRESVTNRYYTPKRCAFVEKPVFSDNIYHCNRGLCPAYWKAGDYSECKCNEERGDVEGVRTRYMKCVQEQITGQIEEVPDSQCLQEKLPELTETCNCPKANRRKIYARAPDKAPKVYSRLIGATPLVRSLYNASSPLRRHLRDERLDKTGVWLMAEWSEHECEANGCGEGYKYRTIYCDRTPPYTDLCDLRYTPEQKKVCGPKTAGQQRECRKGVWFTSDWGKCSGDCFQLQRKRSVLCISDSSVVEDTVCEENGPRPRDTANCTHKEVDYCSPKWHYSEWSECSRSCGEGIQRRYAKCLEFDWKQNAMVESNNCKYLDREPVYGTCNVQKCEEVNNSLAEALKDSVPSTKDVCSDDFGNCKRINRQRLCKLQYYRTYCCLTCNGY